MRAVLLLLAMSAPALAYLDPVTGNILVQAVLAAFAALALGYHRLKLYVQKLFGKGGSQPPEEEKKEQNAPEKSDAREEEGAKTPPLP
jgi:hypothetical protein